MKPIYLLSGLLFWATSAWAQETSLKYGKITDDELTMTTYKKDTSAAAVVIYERGELSYDFNQVTGFQVTYDVKRKIKLLKPEGVDEGDISISYIRTTHNKERVTGIEAIAYMMENGKVVKTKLEKKYIFDEAVTDRVRRIKFSIPGVKAGAVIEYKYTKTSDDAYDIPNWNMQDEIPVMHSEFEVLIPEYFIFNVDAAKGYERIYTEKTTKNQTFSIVSSSGQHNSVVSKEPIVQIFGAKPPCSER